MVKRLFPNLPSQNIRATAGFFGPARPAPHRRRFVRVRHPPDLARPEPELARRELNSVEAIAAWLKNPSPEQNKISAL